MGHEWEDIIAIYLAKQWGLNRNMSIAKDRGLKDLAIVLCDRGISLNFFIFFEQEAKYNEHNSYHLLRFDRFVC